MFLLHMHAYNTTTNQKTLEKTFSTTYSVTIDLPVNASILVVASQQEHVLRVLGLVCQQETDAFQLHLTSADIMMDRYTVMSRALHETKYSIQSMNDDSFTVKKSRFLRCTSTQS